jgi:hypothetical protein
MQFLVSIHYKNPQTLFRKTVTFFLEFLPAENEEICFNGPDLPGYMGGRFCKIAWRTAMMIFRNIAQSNKTSPPFQGIFSSVL